MDVKCKLSGRVFEVSDHEIELRKKFGFGGSLPEILPKYRFRYLGAFWPQWNLHKRKCDKTGDQIISVFRPDCVYPVWKRREWFGNNNPPSKDFDPSRTFFDQAWDLFQKCPIPHVFENNNYNCEYTDDWYYSKNCYLCHSGQYSENCSCCYECDHCKNVHYGVSVFYSELCFDLINSTNCFNGLFLLNCKTVSDSAFMYDCRDCSNCLFCFNLRNKSYCFGNKQLSKDSNDENSQSYQTAAETFNKIFMNK